MKRLLLVAVLVSPALLAVDAPPAPAPPPLWSGKAELSYVSTSGNTSTQTIGAAGELLYQPSPWSVLFRGTFVRAEADGDLKARSVSGLLRGARDLSPRLGLFVQAGYLENTFSGIDHRIAGEGGISYAVVKSDRHLLKAELGLGYTKEARLLGDDLAFASARIGLGYKCVISKTAEFTDDASFVEDLKTSDDWRIQNVASVSASVSSIFSLKISHALNYVNRPALRTAPDDYFGKTDTVTSAAVVAKF
jgi:putative salt-induced outer membrane protein